MAKKGYKQTKEHKRKISEALKGRKLSEEHKQKLGLLKKGKNYFKFETNLFKDFSPLNMWLLGLFASDGCMIKEKSQGHRINFSGKIEDMKKIKSHLNQGKIFIFKKLNNHANLYFRDLRVFNRLIKLGMTPRKSKTLSYPNIPKEYKIERHFIRGFFEGDGWISRGSIKDKNFHAGFCSGSKKFLEKLKKRLSFYRINGGKIYLKKSIPPAFIGSAYGIDFSINASKLLYDFIYKDVNENLICSSKKDKFTGLINWHKNNLKYISRSIYKENLSPIEKKQRKKEYEKNGERIILKKLKNIIKIDNGLPRINF